MRKPILRFTRWTITLTVVISLILPYTGTAMASSAGQDGVLAPVNPAFSAWQQNSSSGREQLLQELRHGLGYLPSPVNLAWPRSIPQVTEKKQIEAASRSSLPASYDLRTMNRVTGVRDQGYSGSCWVHAALGSVESVLMPEESKDYSENNMKNRLTDFDRKANDGGDAVRAAAYLARWEGPVLESQDPYIFDSEYSSAYPPDKHLSQMMFIPSRKNSLDNDKIKQALMDYGALVFSMTFDYDAYNEATSAYYYTGAGEGNHEITLVGWDDNYSRNNFLATPPGDGAFILKNSWGTQWGEQGYFYISYYDTMAGIEMAVFNGINGTGDYTQVYQYDPLGWTGSFGYKDDTASFANIFTADADITVKAASFYAVGDYDDASEDSSYEVSVYKNLADVSNPESGTLVDTQTKHAEYSGYYTVDFADPAFVAKGEKYSVVITAHTPGYGYPIPIENAVADYSSQAASSIGQSFVSRDGAAWSDITKYDSTANVCIKAFADYGGAGENIPAAGVSVDKESAEMAKYLKLTAAVSPDNASDKRVVWSSDHPEIAVVSDEGDVVGVSPGEAEITVTTVDGGYQAACRVTVTAEVADKGPGMAVYLKNSGEEIDNNQILQLQARGKYKLTISPYDAEGNDIVDPKYRFFTSDYKIAYINKQGVLIAGKNIGIGIMIIAEEKSGTGFAFLFEVAKPCTSKRILGTWDLKQTAADGSVSAYTVDLKDTGRMNMIIDGITLEDKGSFSLAGTRVKITARERQFSDGEYMDVYCYLTGRLFSNKISGTYNNYMGTGTWEAVRSE